MPLPSEPLRSLGFLTIGLFDEADPRAGHESTLDIIALGERLGVDRLQALYRALPLRTWSWSVRYGRGIINHIGQPFGK